MNKLIYLDNAATTKTAPEVLEAMLPYFSEYYGNPSSIYDFGQKSKEAVTRGRQQIADVLNARKEDIYFTAGGSEADNWALKATFEAYKSKGNHIITTKIEHHAILHTCEYLEKERGAKITYLDVDENGIVRLDELEKAITPDNSDFCYVCKQRDRFYSADQRNRPHCQRTWHPVPHRCSSGILSGSDRCRRV